MSINEGTGYTFSESGIATSAPNKSGVYVIYNRTTWIYIGEAKDIQARLYEHFRGESDQSECIWDKEPKGFDFELCDALTRTTQETYWIKRLSPSCNRT